MRILRKLRERWNGIDKKLREIYVEKVKLMDICAPYKIQSYETPYSQKEEVIDSRIRLWELGREERNLKRRYGLPFY